MAKKPLVFKSIFPLIIAAVLTVACSWVAPAILTKIEAKVDDRVWRLIGGYDKLEQRIVVIDIDEQSVSQYGQWPWPREKVAELMGKAIKSDVSMAIFDMVFPLKQSGDDKLVQLMKQRTTTLAQILAINADDDTQVGALAGGSIENDCTATYPAANAIIANNKKLASAAATVGHIVPKVDSDGVVRRIPSLICFKGQSYPALALSVLAEGHGQSSIFKLHKNKQWWRSPYVLMHPSNNIRLNIPVSSQGYIRIPWWLSRQSIISISALDLMQGTVPNDVLKGKWAIIGSTAFGSGDSIATPQSGLADGVEVHVQLISALLDNRLPFAPRIATALEILMALIMAAFLYMSSRAKGLKVVYTPLLTGVFLSVSAIAIHVLTLWSQAMLIPWLSGVIFSITSSMLMALFGYAASRKEGDQLYQNLSSYLPAHAAKWIAFQQPVDVLDAKHEQVLVLHADLRNFSAWCNHLPAQQAGAVLHGFYTLTGNVIQKHGGDIEAYVGNAVTAVWRSGSADKRALIAAKEIIAHSETLMSNETGVDHIPPLAIGIGMEYGEVLAGAFGLSHRRAYTVTGKTVTTAMQLEALTADMAEPILIGEKAAKQWGHNAIKLDSLGAFLLKDTPEPIELYTVAQTTEAVT